MRLCGQFSWVCALLADRDLVFQDFSLVLVPGRRLSCMARAEARGVRRLRAHRSGRLSCMARAEARGVRRFARTGEERAAELYGAR
jgi:hypothetical protein